MAAFAAETEAEARSISLAFSSSLSVGSLLSIFDQNGSKRRRAHWRDRRDAEEAVGGGTDWDEDGDDDVSVPEPFDGADG